MWRPRDRWKFYFDDADSCSWGPKGERRLMCRFLGRLHDVAIHVRRRQASEKRQGTKSRLVGSGGCSRLYGDLAEAGVAGMVHWEQDWVAATGSRALEDSWTSGKGVEALAGGCCEPRVRAMGRTGSSPTDERRPRRMALRRAVRAAVMRCRSSLASVPALAEIAARSRARRPR